MTDAMKEDIVAMARAAMADERLSDGALYGKLADKIEEQRAAIRDLIKYGDDHDWGLMPEGATIERARNLT